MIKRFDKIYEIVRENDALGDIVLIFEGLKVLVDF